MASSSVVTKGICIGASVAADPATAADELAGQLAQSDMALVVVFASSDYDLAALAGSLGRSFGAVPVIGCTTAGEIGPAGYTVGGLSGFSLSSADILAEIAVISDVSRLSSREGQSLAYGLRRRLAARQPGFDPARCFALLLVDGLCVHEELLARALHDGLGGIPLVGGSAGDGLKFRSTRVLQGGRFHADAAVLLLAATPHPFLPVKTQHFHSGPRRLVVTAACPERRIVTEIDGFSAAAEYARVVGLSGAELGPRAFSAHPMAVKVGGADFIRSIQKVNADGSMTFFCAIDEGIVFNIATAGDLLADLKALFADVVRRIGPPSLIIGCDCVLRRLEAERQGLIGELSALTRAHHVVGFSTYGEQFRGMHVNHTFTGIAFGAGGGEG